jgi:hypothetical protein
MPALASATAPGVGGREPARDPLSRTRLTVLTVVSAVARILTTLLPARPSQVKAISMPQEGLRATQPAGERMRVLGRPVQVPCHIVTIAISADPQIGRHCPSKSCARR